MAVVAARALPLLQGEADVMTQNSITVQPGKVLVSKDGEDHIIDYPHCHVWTVDLTSKYADVVSVEADQPDEVTVALWANPGDPDGSIRRTLHTDDRDGVDPFTRITFPVTGDGWEVMADVSRYTLTVCLWRPLGPGGVPL
jgi:hypothetical protein